jgi:predicted RecB family nuclease
MTKRPECISLALNGHLKSALLADSMPDLSEGKCVGLDTNLFFSDRAADVAIAKSTCFACPVMNLCGAWASRNAEYGIFGGMTPAERKKRFGSALASTEVDIALQVDFILNGTLDAIATRYEVDQRTVLRWRDVLRQAQLA